LTNTAADCADVDRDGQHVFQGRSQPLGWPKREAIADAGNKDSLPAGLAYVFAGIGLHRGLLMSTRLLAGCAT